MVDFWPGRTREQPRFVKANGFGTRRKGLVFGIRQKGMTGFREQLSKFLLLPAESER
jgi:hypothetical protein